MTKIIAIDPGLKTGIAIMQQNVFLDIFTTDFWGCIEIIDNNKTAMFVLEKPNTNHVWHKKIGSANYSASIGLRVGSVIREAQLIERHLLLRTANFVLTTPAGKSTATNFKNITGYEGRTNQHERDAGLMAWTYNKQIGVK
ncbi:MAG: hypothetical protein WC465_04945 [Patescibacteria group bacterium]